MTRQFAIYIITDPPRRAMGQRKIGIHTGDIEKLRSRYITSLPELIIEHFHTMPDIEDCREIETHLKTKYAPQRIPNNRGVLSEWAAVQLHEIISEIKALTTPLTPPQQHMITHAARTFTIPQIKELFDTKSMCAIEGQRDPDPDRVLEIAKYISEHYHRPDFYSGAVVLSYRDGVYRIVDGQHRLRAMAAMSPAAQHRSAGYVVTAEVRHGLSVEQERNLFMAINQSKPVPELLLQVGDKKLIHDSIRTAIVTRYKSSISPSSRPVSPNFNIDAAMDEIIRRGEATDAASFIADIIKLNDHIGARLTGDGGYGQYKKYALGAAARHDAAKFRALLESVERKAAGVAANRCYFGLVSQYQWAAFIGHIDRY